MNIPKFNLQFFAEGEEDSISTVDGLDALLNTGNTSEEETGAEETDETDSEDNDEDQESGNDSGGDQSLNGEDDTDAEDDKEEDEKDTQPKKTEPDAKANAAFAKMRTENVNLKKTVQQIAKALGIDPNKPDVLDNLTKMAAKKLAEEAKLPVEVYNELTATREQLSQLQQKQNIETARRKVYDLRTAYSLDDNSVGTFLDQLEAEGIDPIANPEIDLEYHYYRMNKDAIIEAEREKARQEAIRSSAGSKTKTSKTKGSTPASQIDSDEKIDTVKGLDALLNGK